MIAPIFGSITRPLLSPLVSGLRDELFGAFTPRSLFNDGSIGVLYDNNDFVNPTTWRRNLLTYTDEWTTFAAVNGTKSVASGVLFFTETAINNIHELSNVSGIVLGTTYTYQVKAKADLRGCINLGNSGYILAKYNLRTGVVNFTSGGNPWFSNINASIINSGDGYYQCTVTATCLSTQPAANWRIGVSDNDGDSVNGQPSYLGIVGYGVYLKEIQVEVGSTATAYQRITDFNTEFLAAFPNTTMFVDAAGTTPATVNGLVGLQLDKSQGLVLGSELRANGVTALTGVATAATYSTTTGVGTVTRVDASNQSYVTWTGLDATAYYQITISNTGAGLLYVRTGAGIGVVVVTIPAGNTVTCSVLASGSAISIAADSGTANFTLGTIKKLPGNHRYQATTGSKPILRGTPTGGNLVTNGNFVSDVSGWTNSGGGSFVFNSGKGRFTRTALTDFASQSLTTVNGGVYRVTLTGTQISGNLPRFAFGPVNSITSGSNTIVNMTSATPTVVMYFTATATTSYLMLGATADGAVVDFDNIEVVDVSAGQVTAPYGLQYDGVDDFLQTAAVDFTATDKMFVCAGVRKLSDAGAAVFAELSINIGTNNGSFSLWAPNSASPTYRWYTKGTVETNAAASGFAAPISNTLSCISDISGDSAIIRVNGTQTGSSVLDQGAGNYGKYAIYFGRRAGTSLPFNGLDFGFVIVGKTLTAAQISSTERWMAQRTGVSI